MTSRSVAGARTGQGPARPLPHQAAHLPGPQGLEELPGKSIDCYSSPSLWTPTGHQTNELYSGAVSGVEWRVMAKIELFFCLSY